MRTRTNHNLYKKHAKNSPNEACNFCKFSPNDGQVVSESEHFWIATNLFAYNVWDDRNVDEHLMLLPKRHVTSLSELTSAERADYIEQLVACEAHDYSTYTRAPGNASKSIPHLHTHLVRLSPKLKRVIVRIKRPYILWAV
jgi:diadenosine tetraphosphate (Ap4A) HIT family hydrolase